MIYFGIKYIHVGSVVITGVLFLLRFGLRLAKRPVLAAWLRIAPHVNDTVLLLTAIALAFMSGQYPLQQPWLTAKVVLLLVYIVVGHFALKRCRTPAGIVAAGVVSLAVFAAIVLSALTRLPPPWV